MVEEAPCSPWAARPLQLAPAAVHWGTRTDCPLRSERSSTTLDTSDECQSRVNKMGRKAPLTLRGTPFGIWLRVAFAARCPLVASFLARTFLFREELLSSLFVMLWSMLSRSKPRVGSTASNLSQVGPLCCTKQAGQFHSSKKKVDEDLRKSWCCRETDWRRSDHPHPSTTLEQTCSVDTAMNKGIPQGTEA